MALQCPKVMAFGLLMTDIPVYVSCKFEIYIFKIALVISKNVCIAFPFVLSIYFITQTCPCNILQYFTAVKMIIFS